MKDQADEDPATENLADEDPADEDSADEEQANEDLAEENPADETVRVWLVERTYSDDEQNLIVLTYATPDGAQYFRKERALPSFTGAKRETTAAVGAEPGNLGTVDDPEQREQYALEAQRMAELHDPDDTI